MKCLLSVWVPSVFQFFHLSGHSTWHLLLLLHPEASASRLCCHSTKHATVSTTSTQQVICHSVKTESSESTKIAQVEIFWRLFQAVQFYWLRENIWDVSLQPLQPPWVYDTTKTKFQAFIVLCLCPTSTTRVLVQNNKLDAICTVGLKWKCSSTFGSNAPGSKCAGLTFKIQFHYLFVWILWILS